MAGGRPSEYKLGSHPLMEQLTYHPTAVCKCGARYTVSLKGDVWECSATATGRDVWDEDRHDCDLNPKIDPTPRAVTALVKNALAQEWIKENLEALMRETDIRFGYASPISDRLPLKSFNWSADGGFSVTYGEAI